MLSQGWTSGLVMVNDGHQVINDWSINDFWQPLLGEDNHTEIDMVWLSEMPYRYWYKYNACLEY